MAHGAGTPEDELIESLNGAIADSGCSGEQWVMLRAENK